jgi:putative DNA primase/helicase
MNAEGIYNILGGRPKSGGGYMCHCPAHDDKNPSLSLIDGDSGTPIFKCMSGCSQDAVIVSLKERGAWHSNSGQRRSKTEIKAQTEAAEMRKAGRIAEDEAKHAGAVLKAADILGIANGDPAQHSYVIAKGLPVDTRIKRGVWPQRGWDDALLIPLYDSSGYITTISAIDTDGTKDLLKGGKKTGCFHPIGKVTDEAGIIVIGEGWATVAAVCNVMECPGAVAFDAGNLEAVSREIRRIKPLADIVIIADDDQKPETDSNPGKTAANKAALAVDGRIAVPAMGRKADAWDVWHEQGVDGIRDMMAATTLATVATLAVANIILPSNHIDCDLTLEPEEIQRLRGAMAVIPSDVKLKPHTSAEIIGWALRHTESGIQTDVGASLCSEWDRLSGGLSLDIFNACDPNYHSTKPISTASIYALAKQCGWTEQVPWAKPEPLITHQEADPYPLAELPGLIGEAVREVIDFVQCPVALGACSALAVVSVLCQGHVDVRRAPKLEGPTSLFLLAVADSGERKTSVDGYFSGPVKNWDAEQVEAAKPKLNKHGSEATIREAKKSGLVAALTDARKKDNPTEDLELQLMKLESEKPEEPKVARLLFSDATPEALAYSLAHCWPVGGILSSEAGIVFGGHAMGKDSAMRNMSVLNSLWDADTITIDRRTSPSYTVSGVRLTMSLAVQSETVRCFLDGSKGLARGIGFLARFLIAWPESTQGNRMFKDPPEQWPELAKFHRRLGELLDHELTFDDKGNLSPVMLELSEEAKNTWRAFHDEVEAELRPGGDMAEAKDVASKAADNAVRLAALFHMFENGIEGAIQEEHMMAGAIVSGWHLYEARRFMSEIAVDANTFNALKLDTWLVGYCKQHRISEVSRKEIQQKGPNCTRKKVNLDAALGEIVEAGRAREVIAGRQKMVEINPSLLED